MAASDSRNERQLMRQRSAGTREAGNVDFGLDFQVPTGREERKLMRQRGAGKRQIDNIDFGFAFPTPNRGRRSQSKTPQSIRTSVPRSAKTPAGTSSELSAAPLRNGARNTIATSPRRSLENATPQEGRKGSEPQSKRRRLNQPVTEHEEELNPREKSIHDTPILNGSPISFFPIIEEADARVETDFTKEPADASVPTSPLFFHYDEGDKENNTHHHQESSLALLEQRNSEGAAWHSSFKAKSLSTPDQHTTSISIDRQNSEDESEESLGTHITNSLRQKSSDPTIKRRKKRRSVVLSRKKRRSSGNTQSTREESTVMQDSEDVEAESGLVDEHAREQSTSGIEESHPVPKNGVRPYARDRIKGRRPYRDSSVASMNRDATNADGEDGDETYSPDEASPQPTPAPKRKRNSSKRVSDSSSTGSSFQRTNKSTYPIQIYRLSHTHALPTISEENNDSHSETEQIGKMQTITNRTAPNAVDVLAQLCRETINSSIDKLRQSNDSAISRTDLKRKCSALEAFGEDLNDRLFDMSEAVEHSLTLESRLRKSKREKAELQARWLAIRRQRDQLALRSDAIRLQHWENEADWRRRWEISEAAYRTEMDLEGQHDEEEEDQQEADLEFLAKEVALNVSSASENGGILDRVKMFNRQLEKIAALLEKK